MELVWPQNSEKINLGHFDLQGHVGYYFGTCSILEGCNSIVETFSESAEMLGAGSFQKLGGG